MKTTSAFPRSGFWPSQQGGDIESVRERMGASTEPQEGMTLRDYFAAHALTLCTDYPTAEKSAQAAFNIADAMTKAREQ